MSAFFSCSRTCCFSWSESFCRAKLALTRSRLAWEGSLMLGMAARAEESDSALPTLLATSLMMGAAIRELTAPGVSSGVCGEKASLISRAARCASVSLITCPLTTAAVSAVPQPDTDRAAAMTTAASGPRKVRSAFTDNPFRFLPGLPGLGRGGRGGDAGGVAHAVEQHGADEVAGPLQHCSVAQGSATHPRRHRLGHENRTDRVLDERLRVQPLQPQLGRLAQLDGPEAHEVALHADVGDARLARDGAQPGHLDEVAHRLRRCAVAVDQRGLDLGEGGLVDDTGELLVGLEPQTLARDVVVRQVGVDGQLDLDLGRRALAVAAEVGHRLAHEAHIEVEADPCDVAGLLTAEQVAGAADLEVLHRDLDAGPEVGVAGNRLQAVVRRLGHRLLGRVEEVAVGPLPPTADPPAELVQLAQAEDVGPLHDQGVGVGDVQARLDDRGADEHVELLVPEVEDDLLQLVLTHLAVGRRDARLGDQLADAGGGPLDRAHLVVHEEDLALAQQLAADGRRDLLLLVGADVGQDGVALLRRGGQGGHIGDADMARTSTAVRSVLSCSLCSTPNRCSSSTMTRPRSL